MHLVALLADPQRVAEIRLETIPGILGDLERLRVVLWTRMISGRLNPGVQDQDRVEDRLLTVEEAAQRLGVAKDWLYRRATKLPFTIRLGTRLRFSALGIERYIRQREGRG